MPHVIVRDLPETLQAALKDAGYHKKDIQVIIKESESVFSAGGKGYRGFAVIVNMALDGVDHQLQSSCRHSNLQYG